MIAPRFLSEFLKEKTIRYEVYERVTLRFDEKIKSAKNQWKFTLKICHLSECFVMTSSITDRQENLNIYTRLIRS